MVRAFLLALDYVRLAIATRWRRWPPDAEHGEKRVPLSINHLALAGGDPFDPVGIVVRVHGSQHWSQADLLLMTGLGAKPTFDEITHGGVGHQLFVCKRPQER
jgi:hypothetical protein